MKSAHDEKISIWDESGPIPQSAFHSCNLCLDLLPSSPSSSDALPTVEIPSANAQALTALRRKLTQNLEGNAGDCRRNLWRHLCGWEDTAI